ncbi:MAG: hypothetical protein KGL39_38475 [Patescibacteria group bacterium]|nr:hypothetical protein [Patescibacteria group bacterium]
MSSIASHMADMASGRMPGKGPEKGKPEMHKGGEEHADIKAHLERMHTEHGGKHSYVHHHEDGTHTSHHIDDEGNVSGPHEHDDTDALNEHMKGFAGGDESASGEDDHDGLM